MYISSYLKRTCIAAFSKCQIFSTYFSSIVMGNARMRILPSFLAKVGFIIFIFTDKYKIELLSFYSIMSLKYVWQKTERFG